MASTNALTTLPTRILRVKELHDSWGSTLDLTDTVGDVFDDRSSSGDILTSICKVLRYPPQAAELYHSHRYASLLPESSARPQKRTLPPPVPIFESVQRPLRSVEMWDGDDGLSSQESANKRRKTHDVRALDDHMQARALPPSQLIGKAILDLSQSAGTQGSEHQVEDSQRSPQRKSMGPCLFLYFLLIIVSPQSIRDPDVSPIQSSPRHPIRKPHQRNNPRLANQQALSGCRS